MELHLTRFKTGPMSTIGALEVDGAFVCFTCEDRRQEKKVNGETRIPAGRYAITLRKNSPMARRYAKNYANHVGMLWLQNVPGFSYVYIHVGNDDRDTSGCILIGMDAYQTSRGGRVGRSRIAYQTIYPLVASAIERGEPVFITIQD